MNEECKSDKNMENINIELAVLSEEIKNTKAENTDLKIQIREIREDIKKIQWWMLGTLTTSIITLLGILIQK